MLPRALTKKDKDLISLGGREARAKEKKKWMDKIWEGLAAGAVGAMLSVPLDARMRPINLPIVGPVKASMLFGFGIAGLSWKTNILGKNSHYGVGFGLGLAAPGTLVKLQAVGQRVAGQLGTGLGSQAPGGQAPVPGSKPSQAPGQTGQGSGGGGGNQLTDSGGGGGIDAGDVLDAVETGVEVVGDIINLAIG